MHKLTPEEEKDIRDWMPSKEDAVRYFEQFPVDKSLAADVEAAANSLKVPRLNGPVDPNS